MIVSQLIKSRLDHLASFDTNRHSWQNDRFYRQLAEFLFQSGYHKTGLKLSDALPIREFVNSGLFLKIAELEEDLGCQKTQKCLAWCNQNTSRLRKIKSRFEVNIINENPGRFLYSKVVTFMYESLENALSS